MKKAFILSLLLLLGLATSSSVLAQCYNLVWSDEFNDNTIDPNKWSFQIGDGGWGNNELQYYTDRPENAVEENGVLKIIALEESYNGADYTSARLRTINLADWTYGKFEASMKLPEGQGLWPAFWMLPSENVYGTWPFSGEIDIMELLGHQPNKTYGTVHTWGTSAPFSSGANYTLPSGTFSDGFHTLAIEWEPTEIRWYVDGALYATKTPADLSPHFWPFIQNFHLLLNVAVGGNWPNPPDATTVFPQTMEVDYIRVYQELPNLQITGPDLAEPNSTQIYELPNLASTSYSWSVPAGATITAGQNTSAITVNWGNTGGSISCTTTNTCGSETISMNVEVTSNLFVNPDFESDYSLWDTRTHNNSDADFEIDLVNPIQGAKTACITINNIGTGGHNWNVQLSRPNLDLLPEAYQLEFKAKADVNGRAIAVAFIDSDDFNLLHGTGMTLSDSWATKTFTFTPTAANTMTFNIDMAFETGTFCFDDFQFSRLAALPVAWLDFTATTKGSSIDLNWSTASETNSYSYEVQRSDDAINFRTIGQVAANGFTTEISNYQYIDKSPFKGKNYYRLIQIDQDGAPTFSTIVLANLVDPIRIQFFPNPVISNLNFERSINNNKGLILIYNEAGQLLKQQKIMAGEHQSKIDLSQWPKGVYFLDYSDQDTQQSIRFIKG